jgi:hypothetical protein
MNKEISIAGHKFQISAPYQAGHVVTEAEAKVLVQTRAENIGNNFRKRVKEAGDNHETLKALAAEIAKYDAEYAFTSANAVRTPVDPVEAEAMRIAREYVSAKIKALGNKSLKAYFLVEGNEDKYEAAVEKVSLLDDTIKLAKQRVANKKKVAELGSDDLGLGA